MACIFDRHSQDSKRGLSSLGGVSKYQLYRNAEKWFPGIDVKKICKFSFLQVSDQQTVQRAC